MYVYIRVLRFGHIVPLGVKGSTASESAIAEYAGSYN